MQAIPAAPPSASGNPENGNATQGQTPATLEKTRLTNASLADVTAQPGDSNVRIILGGTGFVPSMVATIVFDGKATTWPVEVSSAHVGAIYVTLPTDYNAKSSYMVSLAGPSGYAGARHLDTHFIPSGKDLAAKLQENKDEEQNLKKYAASTQSLATARLQAAAAQRSLEIAEGAATAENVLSIPSDEPEQPNTVNPYCHPDNTTEQTDIRVRRSLMAPKEASDSFGRRLGRHYIVFQVSVENKNTSFQYIIHDVSVDLSRLMSAPPGSYQWAFSSQDLSVLRGVPEKGQDYDPRNLTLHIMQGVGTVAGGITGLTATSIQSVYGGAVSAYNGPFLTSFLGIFPDHTATQLNRLSDSAFTGNTVVAKQQTKVFAIFVPAPIFLSSNESKAYWDNPIKILNNPTHDFRNADVCVDGAFITEVPSLVLTKIAYADVTKAKPGASVDLIISGSNLVTGDTVLNAFNQTAAISNIDSNNSSGHATVTLPSSFDPQAAYPAFLSSPKSGQKSTTVNIQAIAPMPILTSIIFADPATAQANAKNIQLKLSGSKMIDGDTLSIFNNDVAVKSISADGTSGQITIDIPPSYDPAKPTSAVLKTKSGLPSNSESLFAAKPTLTKAVSSTPAADGTVTITLTGTALSTNDTTVALDSGSPIALKTASPDGTSATVVVTPPAGTSWPGTHTATVHTTNRGNSASASITQ